MGYIAKLTKGSRTLDLNSGVYSLGLDFVPPPVNISPLLATGTAANKQGSSKRGERPLDRSWSFSVKVLGGSEAQCRLAATPLLNMLGLAGDEDEPLYFEYRGNNDVPIEPTWGQYGVNLRYEIIHASGTGVWSPYFAADVRSAGIFYTVNLTIKPYALGKRQRLASALGGILENTYGTADGRSRGLLIPGEVTNKMTNPIFGAGVTTGWTASGTMLAALNTDPQYVLFGGYSVRLVNRGATANTYTMSIAAGNTNNHTISAYVKLPDGGEVTEGDINIYYNGAATLTKMSNLGDGFWMLSQTVTGVVAATTVGIEIIEDRNCYLCGMQFEQLVANQQITATPLCHGDLLGCAWTGTAHASTSTRTAAEVSLPLDINNYNPGQGTIRTVWNAPLQNTYPNAYLAYLWQVGAVTLHYDEADGAFHFSGIESAAYELQEDGTDPIVIHCTWGEAGIQLSVNGTIVSNASFSAASMPSEISIGSANGIGPAGGTFMDFAIYTHAMTAAEIMADANNILAHIRGGDGVGQQLAPIPWLWTKDGDNVVDNHDDTGEDNWCVCNGIPGNADAETLFDMTLSANLTSTFGIYLSRWDTAVFASPNSYLWSERSGTADGGSSGGEYQQASIDTTGGTFQKTIAGVSRHEINGRTFYLFTRLYDAGANLQMAFQETALIETFTTEYINLSTTTAFRLYVSPPLRYPGKETSFVSEGYGMTLWSPALAVRRAAGGATANVRVDYFTILPAPLVQIIATTYGYANLLYKGRVARVASSGQVVGAPALYGDTVELRPGRSNQLITLIGGHGRANDITYTLTYNKIEVTPRWELLN